MTLLLFGVAIVALVNDHGGIALIAVLGLLLAD